MAKSNDWQDMSCSFIFSHSFISWRFLRPHLNSHYTISYASSSIFVYLRLVLLLCFRERTLIVPTLRSSNVLLQLFFDCRVCCVWSSPCILVDHFHGGIECSCWSVRHSGGILAAVVPASYVPAPAVFAAANATILPLLAKAFLALPQRYLPTRCYSLGRRGFWSNGSSRNGGISTMNTFVPLLFSGSNGGGAPGRRRRHHCNWIGALDAATSFRCLVTVSWPLRPSSFLNLFPPTCNGRSRSILRSSFDRT